MAEHRVPMLGAALRRRSDPARSRDPRVRELVAALSGLEVAPPPRPEFRAELRAQLVAVAPRLVTEGEPTLASPARARNAEPAKARAEATPKRGFRWAKPLIAAACVLTAFVLLLGGAVLLSQHALPGDALYGLKRASEDTEYGLTGGTVAKGKLKLDFAGRRIGEVADLLPRASAMAGGAGAIADSGQLNSSTSKLVRDTLNSADADIRKGVGMLGTAAVHGRSAGPLNAITAWVPGQQRAMSDIVARIPAGSLHHRAAMTLALIARADARAKALEPELNCGCLGSTKPDDLGPTPCATGCAPSKPGGPTPRRSGSSSSAPSGSSGSPGSPGGGATTNPRSVTRPGGTSRGATVTPPPGGTTAPAPGGGGGGGGAATGTKPPRGSTTIPLPHSTPTLPKPPITLPVTPPVSLPHLPLPSPSLSLPISVNSSCISIGPIVIGDC